MNAAKTAFTGNKLTTQVRANKQSRKMTSTVAMAGIKKVNSYDDTWNKGFFSTGYFVEDKEQAKDSFYKNIEKKKILSTVESLGLLSKAEKAGFTLTKIEQAGLLTTAENLGLLALAEDVLVMEPAQICSYSLPFVVLTVASLSLIPHDNIVTSVLSYSLAAGASAAAAAAFITGVVIAGLQED